MVGKGENAMYWADGLGTACDGASALVGGNTRSDLQSIGNLGVARKMKAMKKLMIAASAALCAAVGLAEITSDNIVG